MLSQFEKSKCGPPLDNPINPSSVKNVKPHKLLRGRTNVEIFVNFAKVFYANQKHIMKTLKTEGLVFLEDLANNNNKAWFDENRTRYEGVKKDLRQFFNGVFEELKKTDDLEEMHVFRINRDIRFSADKTPYKNHISVHFKRRKPQLRGGYYLHIEPGNKSLLAGGFWAPSKEDTLRIRQEFEMDAQPMREIMSHAAFKKVFPNICGEQLKTAPKGFDKNHDNIDLIRHKNWYFETYFTDEEVLADGFQSKVVETFLLLRPFFDYMSDVLGTDANGEPIYS